MRLHIVIYKILAPFVGVDLYKNFCNNKSPPSPRLGIIYRSLFFLLINNLYSKNK